jgi:hypothetical protein
MVVTHSETPANAEGVPLLPEGEPADKNAAPAPNDNTQDSPSAHPIATRQSSEI